MLAVFLSFVMTCVVIELTPGPNMAYLAVLSAANGRRAGFAATLGIALGLLLIGLAAALGVATLISHSPWAYEILRWGGVAYLLWLAWDGWRDETETSPGTTDVQQQHRKFFRRGLIVNLLNPKAAFFYVAILPGFIVVDHAAVLQAVLLTVTYVLVATTIHTVIVTLAGSIQAFLTTGQRRLILRRFFSLLLVGIALWLGWSLRSV